jgi:hypothetical protein
MNSPRRDSVSSSAKKYLSAITFNNSYFAGDRTNIVA